MSAYVRQSHRARSTGTVVEVLDADHADSVFDSDEGGRWVTICTTHSDAMFEGDVFVQHLTLATAMGHATEPEYWCEGCMAARPDNSLLTVQDVIVATNLWTWSVPERATGIEWVGHDHVDPISLVMGIVGEPDLLDSIADDERFRWDYSGRNDAWPEWVARWSDSKFTETTYAKQDAPF